jgi:hypothetical protein
MFGTSIGCRFDIGDPDLVLGGYGMLCFCPAPDPHTMANLSCDADPTSGPRNPAALWIHTQVVGGLQNLPLDCIGHRP